MPVLQYFDHFPLPADVNAPEHARSPSWGTGVVIASRIMQVPVGTRIHGLFPFSPYVVLAPKDVTSTQFLDATAHRQHLIPAYLTYMLHKGPIYEGMTTEEEDWQVGTGVLFSTGWSMAQTAATHSAKPTAVVLTSASSRTSRGAAFAAKFHKLPLEVIGITSSKNIEYVSGLGTYDTVCSYQDLKVLMRQKVAVFDVAGNAEAKKAIYEHFGEDVVYFGGVGLSHVEHAGRQVSLQGLGGAEPATFLVFAALQQIEKVYGKKDTTRMLMEATAAYRGQSLPSFQAIRKYGPEETAAVFEEMVKDKTKPECTYICSLWPKDLHEPPIASKI
eukprot:gnl/MRDRNA2_/MRDRNA2_153259_c0_seq1.p1 gnl/MRDRNA2_/MRDRNA2_153259_c0~~gnl/MRDRNA2_/MRDRNA2_153259_c0_seq1.p1  ORF type:complete len:341 (-),score=55.90 gnl/MRDRNA2_/MRDRNA2_153259_c0_seq1:64-1056(-)